MEPHRRRREKQHFINYTPWYGIYDKITPALILSDRSITVDWTLSFLTGSLLIACPSHRVMISGSTTAAKRGRNTGQMEPGQAGTWGGSFRTCNQSHAEFQQSASGAAQIQISNIKMIDEVQNAWFFFPYSKCTSLQPLSFLVHF